MIVVLRDWDIKEESWPPFRGKSLADITLEDVLPEHRPGCDDAELVVFMPMDYTMVKVLKDEDSKRSSVAEEMMAAYDVWLFPRRSDDVHMLLTFGRAHFVRTNYRQAGRPISGERRADS
jgi:hypothetical protein